MPTIAHVQSHVGSQTFNHVLEGKAPLVSGFDADAQDYFDRAEALDANAFDLTSINASYTPAYVKDLWNSLIIAMKANGVVEACANVGVTFAALAAKPLYASGGNSSVTINNHVSGDYTAAGTGGGLSGDAPKEIDSEYAFSSFDGDDFHLGVYKVSSGDNFRVFLGVRDNAGPTNITIEERADPSIRFNLPSSDAFLTPSAGLAHLVGSRRGVNDVEVYHNGASLVADTSTASVTSSDYGSNLGLRARYSDLPAVDSTFNGTSALFHWGTGLTDAEVSALFTAVDAFMTGLGANV